MRLARRAPAWRRGRRGRCVLQIHLLHLGPTTSRPRKRAATSAKRLGMSVTSSRSRRPAGARAQPALLQEAPRARPPSRARCRRPAARARERCELALDDLAQQRVVRAAEHERVDLRRARAARGSAAGEPRHLALGPALLRERDEQRRGLARRPRRAGRAAATARAYAPDAIVPAVARRRSRPRASPRTPRARPARSRRAPAGRARRAGARARPRSPCCTRRRAP